MSRLILCKLNRSQKWMKIGKDRRDEIRNSESILRTDTCSGFVCLFSLICSIVCSEPFCRPGKRGWRSGGPPSTRKLHVGPGHTLPLLCILEAKGDCPSMPERPVAVPLPAPTVICSCVSEWLEGWKHFAACFCHSNFFSHRFLHIQDPQ